MRKRNPMFDLITDDYTMTDALVDHLLDEAARLPPDTERVKRIKALFDAKLKERDDEDVSIIVSSTDALQAANRAGFDVDYMKKDDAVERADIFVCSDRRFHDDDQFASCARCHRTIVHRPDAPTELPKVCLYCFAELAKAQR